jgi:hypothetical protein
MPGSSKKGRPDGKNRSSLYCARHERRTRPARAFLGGSGFAFSWIISEKVKMAGFSIEPKIVANIFCLPGNP